MTNRIDVRIPGTAERSEFPRVATGEHGATIDEIHVVQYQDKDGPSIRLFWNLGPVLTTRGTTEEVRLVTTGSPSMFEGNAKFPPANLFRVATALGMDTSRSIDDLTVFLGKSALLAVTRTDDANKGERNAIAGYQPIGAQLAPTVQIKGVVDRRDSALQAEAAGAVEPTSPRPAHEAGDW
ncbi:MAG: hypothetical protein IPO51_14935 [Dehalococcoidia bacterium]|nr:hypothetical protein [Dehalococcoidia bacterium]